MLAAEAASVGAMIPNLFGYYAVQVGALSDVDLLAASRIGSRMVIEIDGDEGVARGARVQGRPSALPLESHSVDVVVLPHVLEYVADPHEALREAVRVLVPEGHLVVCGFNPWSALGARRLVPGRARRMPWSGQFLPPHRLRDWLSLLELDVRAFESHFFGPLVGRLTGTGRLSRGLARLGRAGCVALPSLGGVYVVLARKRISTMTPIRPRWQPRLRLVGVGLAGPRARARS